MKMLKKLALVSAVSMISAGSFAMEAMDDEAMATTTGQDGITINIIPDMITRTDASAMGVTAPTMDAISASAPFYKGLSIGEIRVHDNDGITGNTSSGALVIGGAGAAIDLNHDGDTTDTGEAAVTADSNRTVILAKGDRPIQINVDMVGDADTVTANSQPMLNVEIKQPKMAIRLGSIYVADSYNTGPNGVDNNNTGDDVDNAGATDGNAVNSKVKILDGLEIVMNESTMTIQLGNETQGSMIKADATLAGGLTLNNFALYDQASKDALNADNLMGGTVGSGGSVRASSIKITDTGGADLTTKTSIDVGSRITVSAVTAAGTTAFKDNVVKKASGGMLSTYAAAQAAGPAGAAAVAAADALEPTAKTLANGVADGTNTGTETNTWGGVDTYNGLVITSQLGGANGADIAINNLALGDTNAAVMGDIQIIGLKLGASKIVIMGH